MTTGLALLALLALINALVWSALTLGGAVGRYCGRAARVRSRDGAE